MSPTKTISASPATRSRVEEVLDRLRPYLRTHSGDVELLDVTDGLVRVKMLGACATCPSSISTLKGGIERAIIDEIPQIIGVSAVNF